MSSTPPDAERPIPPCPKCPNGMALRVYTAHCRQDVRCYACKTCGHLWATRDTDDDNAQPTAAGHPRST